MNICLILGKDELNFSGSFTLTHESLTLHRVTTLEPKLFLMEHGFRRNRVEHSYFINLIEISNMRISSTEVDEVNRCGQVVSPSAPAR